MNRADQSEEAIFNAAQLFNLKAAVEPRLEMEPVDHL